jgi:hypothetical protein
MNGQNTQKDHLCSHLCCNIPAAGWFCSETVLDFGAHSSAIAPDLAAAMWLIESLRPLSEIEDPGLIRLMNTVLNICGARLHFEFPSADTVTRRLEALGNDVIKRVRCS